MKKKEPRMQIHKLRKLIKKKKIRAKRAETLGIL